MPFPSSGKFKSESGDLRLYFLCPVEKKYAKGQRINRETKDGCWKKTGKDSSVHHHKELVGSKKTLVFHKNLNLTATGLRGGKAPQRERTDWVMHEYSLGDQYMAKEGIVKVMLGYLPGNAWLFVILGLILLFVMYQNFLSNLSFGLENRIYYY